jgi:exosome complex component RRP41
MSDEWYFDKKGLRYDGRKKDELRPIKIKAGVLENADGSAYLEWGNNKVYAAVYGPRELLPRHLANPYQATIRYTYRMAPFSVPDRKNPRPGRREIEISKVSSEALSKAVLLERFPNTAIDVFVTLMDADAGTRIAALTAASVALADAGIPMRDLVAGVAVGRIDGKLVVDLNKHEEDAYDAVDMPIAMLPNTEEVVLLQMDGIFSDKEFKEALKMASKAIKEVKKLQEKALKEKYSKEFA